jgi:hypothetical protein
MVRQREEVKAMAVALTAPVLSGDVVLLYTPSLISRTIRGILRLFQEDRVRFSHCMVVTDPASDKCIEAAVTVRRCSLSKAIAKARAAKVIRYQPSEDDPEGRAKVVDLAAARLGDHYGFLRLGLHLCNQVTGLKCFTNVFSGCEVVKAVCSSLAAEGWDKVYGVKFNGVDWQSVEPDDIDDESERVDSGWSTVYDSRWSR